MFPAQWTTERKKVVNCSQPYVVSATSFLFWFLLLILLADRELMVYFPECRCEQTLFNAPGEALALTDAARLFLSSEKENRALQAPGFDEHLQAALNCYSFAIKVHKYTWSSRLLL